MKGWQIFGRYVAYKNELEDKSDLVFLQEVPVSEKNAETYHIDKAIYGTKWDSFKPYNITCVQPEDSLKAKAKRAYNVILYKKEKFSCAWSEDVETKVKQAYTNIASKIRCASYISMAMERGEITVCSEKEAVSTKISEILKESNLKPLPELTAHIEKVWEDTDWETDQNRMKYLADTRENGQIKTLLDKHATMALLEVRDSPGKKILAVCYCGPQHSPDNERALHLLIQVIKEICRLLEGCPVLLAGDFNMELWHADDKNLLKDYLLLDYKPHPYIPTEHRDKANCIDHILLWDDGQRDYTCSLKDVRPKMIDITDGMRMDDEDEDVNSPLNICMAIPIKTDDQTNWENISDGEKPPKSAKIQMCLAKKVAEEVIRKKISFHDPLLATLLVIRRGAIKTENT